MARPSIEYLEMDGWRLQQPGCDQQEISQRNSIISTTQSGPSIESSNLSSRSDILSCVTPGSSGERIDESRKERKEKKKKDKENKAKKVKYDEFGNSMKRTKSKNITMEKWKEGRGSQPGHSNELDRTLFHTDALPVSEFDDFFIQHHRNLAVNDPNISTWDTFAPAKNYTNQEYHPQTMSWDHDQTASITRSSNESYPPPPVLTIDVHHNVDGSTDDDEVTLEMKEQRDALQIFLHRNGHDDTLALQTALAFEEFLKQHKPVLPDASQHSRSIASEISRFEDDEYDIQINDNAFAVNDIFSDADTFNPQDHWDGGTFTSDNDPMNQKPAAVASVHDDGWSNIRRNESFMRRKSLQASTTLRPNHISAASQRSIVAQQQDGRYFHPIPVQFKSPLPPSPHLVPRYDTRCHALPNICKTQMVSRPYEQQMQSLSIEQRECVLRLKAKWDERTTRGHTPFPNEWYIRFAKCSPGKSFNYTRAWKTMKKFDRRYQNLSILSMEKQLLTKTLFPCPGLKSKAGYDMFYMKPSRYHPKKTSVTTVIDNLVYVMQCMLENERCATDGIGFVANMTDWTMSNFSVSYCHQFMITLQGYCVPTRVGLFLIVNPPTWFGSIWSIMKPMLSVGFRKKVHMITFNNMSVHLAPGFERFLPDDIHSGMAPTNRIVQAFIEDREFIESSGVRHA